MRKILFILLLLSIAGVYANEPTPETACCMSFDKGYTLAEECDQYEINKPRCDDIISKYNAITSGFVGWDVIISLLLLTGGLIFALWLLWRGKKR